MPAKSASHKTVKHRAVKPKITGEAQHEETDMPSVEPPAVPPPIVIPDTQQGVPVSQEKEHAEQTTPSTIDIQTTPVKQSETSPVVTPDAQPDPSAAPESTIPLTDPSTTNTAPVVIDQPTDEIPAQNDGFIPESGGNGKKLILVFIIALLLGGGAVAGYFYLSNPYKPVDLQNPPDDAASISLTPAPVATESATASPSASEKDVDIASLNIQVLNGSGTPGEAGVVRDLLKKEGFVQFETGNADSYDYTATEVHLVPTMPDMVFEKIKKALTTHGYTVSEEDALASSSSFHIQIVVGSK